MTKGSLALALVLALGAAAPASAQLTGEVTITSPSGTVNPGTVTFAGGYQGAAGTEQHVGYAVDVSGSTDSGSDDCNGDGKTDVLDDLNGDGRPGTILDCEIAGVGALNASLRTRADGVPVGLIAFGDQAARADMSSTPGELAETSTIADDDGDRVPDVQTVAASLSTGQVQRFTQHSVGSGTDFGAPLQQFSNTLAAATAHAGQKAQHIFFLLSDGQATYPSSQIAAIKTVVANNPALLAPVINTVSVGSGAAGCSAASPLKQIADAFGGVCTAASPSTLTAQLGDVKPLGLDHIDVAFNGTTVRATIDALGGWSAQIPNVAPSFADLPYTVTAARTDGTTSVKTGVVKVRRSAFRYVAIGDSYSSGNGLVPYTATKIGKACQRSQSASAYSVKLPDAAGLIKDDAGSTVDLEACGGAVSKNVVAVPQVRDADDHAQIHYLDDRADLVTLTLGGNDVNFSDVLKFCGLNFEKTVTPTDACEDKDYLALTTGRKLTLDEWANVRLALFQTDEFDTLRQIRAAAPNATIMVADYPHLIAQSGASRCEEFAALTYDERYWIRSMSDTLDTLIAHAADLAGVFSVPVTTRFKDHEKCGGGQDWMYGLEASVKANGADDEKCDGKTIKKGWFTYYQTYCVYGRSFHPMRDGTAAYGTAYSDKLAELAKSPPNGLTRSGLARNPEPTAARSAAKSLRAARSLLDDYTPDELAQIQGFTTDTANVSDLARVQGLTVPPSCGDEVRALPGQLFAIDGSGFAPGTTVTPSVSVGGRSISFAPVTADADGLASANILLPLDVGDGMTVFGLDGQGQGGYRHRSSTAIFSGEAGTDCVADERAAGLLSLDGQALPTAAAADGWGDVSRVTPLLAATPAPSDGGAPQIPASPKQKVTTPCASRRSLAVTLRSPKGGSYRRVVVKITSGHKHITRVVKPKRSGKHLRASVSLRGLPVGTYRVTIQTTTKAGKRSTVKRTYKTCAPKGP